VRLLRLEERPGVVVLSVEMTGEELVEAWSGGNVDDHMQIDRYNKLTRYHHAKSK
jgi:hypothetical protein